MSRRIFFLFSIIFFALFFSFQAFALDKPFDHSTWDQFLKQFVNEKGEVNYRAVHQDSKLLNEYFSQLEKIDGIDFENWPREEKLALWINAYNAGVIKAIAQAYPIKSIQQIPGIWDQQFIRVGLLSYSLNGIHHRQLIGVFHDEKIHAALACGGKSCPRLIGEAYTGPRVEGQLFVAVKRFISDPEFNKIKTGDSKVWLSKIFKWYGSDFKLDFGADENDRGITGEEYAVLSFFNHYLEDAEKIQYLQEARYKIKYLPFDWDLNDWHGPEKSVTSTLPVLNKK